MDRTRNPSGRRAHALPVGLPIVLLGQDIESVVVRVLQSKESQQRWYRSSAGCSTRSAHYFLVSLLELGNFSHRCEQCWNVFNLAPASLVTVVVAIARTRGRWRVPQVLVASTFVAAEGASNIVEERALTWQESIVVSPSSEEA